MCTNQREITNKYTGKKLYVKCGKCPACLQEKAAYRVSRIKANDSPYTDCLMVTLTYRRHDCPYVLRSEAYEFAQGKAFDIVRYCSLSDHKEYQQKVYLPLRVYRDSKYRRVRISSDYDISTIRQNKTVVLDEIIFDTQVPFNGNKDLAHCHDKIGVCYYPDIQKFIARLRLHLIRNCHFHGTFKIYVTSEYGSKSLRPHFHLLLWIPKGTEAQFRSAIAKSWYFSDVQSFSRSIERAFRASSYVASYVNCGSQFPQFLKVYAKPKHSYSKGFGMSYSLFQLSEILSKFKRGSLHYSIMQNREGIPSIIDVPYPSYVIHRYFPKFKGYNRFTSSQICDFSQRLQGLYNSGEFSQPGIKFKVERLYLDRAFFPVYYSDVDLYRISVRLKNAYERFIKDGYYCSFSDYMVLHCRVWSLYASEILKLHLLNPDVPFYEKYDNLEDLKFKCLPDRQYYKRQFIRGDEVHYVDIPINPMPFPIGFTEDCFLVVNPNEFHSTKVSTDRYTISYYDHQKHRSVTNSILSSQYEEF